MFKKITFNDSIMAVFMFQTLALMGLLNAVHNCMATADREVVVFVKELQRDQRPQPPQNSLIHHSPKIDLAFQKI